MRELGLGLDAIAEIVHDGRDQVEALRMHHAWLLTERDRFAALADTVARTIEELEGGDEVTTEAAHWFEGFDPAKQAQWQAFLRKAKLDGVPTTLQAVIDDLAQFLGPVATAIENRSAFDLRWIARGPWR